MKTIYLVVALSVALAACSKDAAEPMPAKEEAAEEKIAVTFENYNQAETARNFNNWARLGAENNMMHRKELSPIGPDAPTIRMNFDTLYSVGVYDNDGSMTVSMEPADVYQSIMILDTDGYTPYYITEPGVYEIENDSEFLFVGVRTGVEDRHSKESFERAYVAQGGISVSGHGSGAYVPPPFDQEQLHALTAEYNKKMLASKKQFTYGDGVTPVDEELRAWSNAAGWGGMMVEVGVANTYTTSDNLPGDKCYAVTFPETGNTYFTSFTIYDTDGYLMEGNSHISSYTWESAEDGSTTIHFNCEGAVNNITSNGNEYNYIVRNYGASQAMIDETINPVKPTLVE